MLLTPNPKAYWAGIEQIADAAPNASLFRFFGNAGFRFDGKRVLEIGFWHGADLLEAHRRGAEIWGVDVNPVAVDSMRRRTGFDYFVQAARGARADHFRR